MLIQEYTDHILSVVKGYVHSRIQDAMNNNNIGGGGTNVHPGTIISGLWQTAPAGYLPCDGSIYQVEDYLVLYDILSDIDGHASWNSGADWTTTFATPDLRGEFLRGTGTNSHANQGSGAAVGVHQDGTLHTTTWLGSASVIAVRKRTQNGGVDITDEDYSFPSSGYMNSNATYSNSPNKNGQFTSRPTNTSVLYCIKY